VGSGQNIDVPPSTQEDMDCEETVPVREDKNIYVGKYIPTQSTKDSYQPRSEIVGPSLRPQYHRDEKEQVEEEGAEKKKPYEIVQVLIGKKPGKKNQVKPEKQKDEAVPETAKDKPLESEQIEAVDLSNIEAEEDYQEDEDDDGQEFALSIGALREEELT
jgi:hypothetical protein